MAQPEESGREIFPDRWWDLEEDDRRRMQERFNLALIQARLGHDEKAKSVSRWTPKGNLTGQELTFGLFCR
jgi:hypothetical protein